MAERLRVSLVCEDLGHEHFARALIHRIAREVNLGRPDLDLLSNRGGHGRAVSHLKSLRHRLNDGRTSGVGLLVVLIDADDAGWTLRRREVAEHVDSSLVPKAVIGCPEPHIEAWMATDPEAFQLAFGSRPSPLPAHGSPARESKRAYKSWLENSLHEAGVELLIDPMSTAPELVNRMDRFKAGKASPSLKAFWDELYGALHPRRSPLAPRPASG